ncbi:NPC intracellular cholesterol transporter 2-like [Malaya genurostris]|uniref:NPC intracellular cholesterol transporter 2-like n=1 Tax=Malaya genurostris TaxID=325434 RepID=UPI0026F3F1E2|nr:NPC intracellular cholesterol transporter 2-like [Malaya genurostris]
MFKFLLISALVPALLLAQTTFPRACPNGAPMPAYGEVNGCTASPCTIPVGAPIVAFANGIVSEQNTDTLTAHISIRAAGLEIPFPIPDDLKDACETGTAPGTCPVSIGQEFDYTLDYEGDPVPISNVTVQIEVGLAGDSGEDVTCIAFEVFISPE